MTQADDRLQTGGPLAGVSVLVTRPAHQAEGLCALIEREGGTPVRFPVLEISDPEDTGPLMAVIDRLETFDIAIFISPNAVNRAMNLIQARRSVPEGLQLAAIGRESASALKRFGRPADIYPRRRFNSEALLELEPMQAEAVAGKRIVIFRGDGGREHLGDTLRERGADVVYAEAYRRVKPRGDTSRLMRLWARGELHVVVLTSGQALRNLYEMVGKLGQQWLRKTPLIVASPRIAELAGSYGFTHTPVVAEGATDEALVAALERWRQTHSDATSPS